MNNINEPLRRERMPFLIKRRATRSRSMVRRDGDGPERPPHLFLLSILYLYPSSLHSRLVVRKTLAAWFDDLPAWGQIAAAGRGRRRGMKAPDGMTCTLGRVDVGADAVVVCVDGVSQLLVGHFMSVKGPRDRQEELVPQNPGGPSLSKAGGGAWEGNGRLNLERGKPLRGPNKCRSMARRTWW